nr:sensor histidine kinase [Psychromicrobium silvestre]
MAAARSAERLALARDIHDVVAHSLSTINVRASVALHLAQKDPSQIEPALQAIKSTSKEALDEVRELLGVLREDAPLVPASLLERLPKLIEDARGTGLQVSLQSNLSQPLSAEQEAASYRIIQEALTNIVRHAGAQQVSVALNSAAGWLRITVDDDGRGLQGNAEGNGLPGIRERVSGLGGTVEFQPRHPGLSVQVAVPLSQEKVKP